MVGLAAWRILRGLLTIAAVFALVFFATRMSGEPVNYLLPDQVSEDVRVRYEQFLELDRSWSRQFVETVRNMAHGDFGYSFVERRPVLDMYRERIGNTLSLAGLAFGITLLVGIPLGVLGAIKRNSPVGVAVMGASFLGYAIPNFILGILFIYLFSSTLRWLPSSGIGTYAHMVMPALTLGLATAASMARFTRSAMLDVVSQDFLRTARAKGAGEGRVILVHAARNAALPVLTLIGLKVGVLIAGSIVVEEVFAWPGIGQLLVHAVQTRDFPVLQFGVLTLAASVVFVNTAVDLAYRLIDPRIRVGA